MPPTVDSVSRASPVPYLPGLRLNATFRYYPLAANQHTRGRALISGRWTTSCAAAPSGRPPPRSLLLTILGEYVLAAPAGVWHETLIGALGTLDVKTQAARQALARSVAGGWLRSERSGRRSRAS